MYSVVIQSSSNPMISISDNEFISSNDRVANFHAFCFLAFSSGTEAANDFSSVCKTYIRQPAANSPGHTRQPTASTADLRRCRIRLATAPPKQRLIA
jgi:hypothetical protein